MCVTACQPPVHCWENGGGRRRCWVCCEKKKKKNLQDECQSLNYWQHPFSLRKRKSSGIYRLEVCGALFLLHFNACMYVCTPQKQTVGVTSGSLLAQSPRINSCHIIKSLYCSWLSHNTTNKAQRTADKPTTMDITQLTAVTQPPGLHGLKLYRMCRLWLQIKHTCKEQS